MNPEIIAQIEAALSDRRGPRKISTLIFLCPPYDDHRPSVTTPANQGLPEHVTDLRALARLAALLQTSPRTTWTPTARFGAVQSEVAK